KKRDDFALRDEVAIIPITGPISKRETFYSHFFNASAVSVLTEIINDALADPDVSAIVLDIDSPGGTVAGTEAFSDLIHGAREVKPIVSFANGMMASAAYWIGSAADQVIVERTADVGSIGVVMVHYDLSENDKQYGVKRTVLSAGKYKALGNSAEPLSDLARQVFQSELNYIYQQFVATVARNRNTNAETVLRNMADGRIFIGQQAVVAGLADRIGTLEDAIELASSLSDKPGRIRTGPLKLQKDKFTSGIDINQACMEAARAEQLKIIDLAEIHFGVEACSGFRNIIKAGVTREQLQAVTTCSQAPGSVRSDSDTKYVLQSLKAAGQEQESHGSAEFMNMVEAYMSNHGCGKVEAMEAVMILAPEVHKAYIKNANSQSYR
ncbi:MAG: signal peptide peptidase SppA, partial [Candidatus Omnitrophica bacterium]|nr:signal peptide peptidase SppA [Candidatus Omnitrophota bacterium]